MKTAWFLFYFAASATIGESGWFQNNKADAHVQKAQQSYDTKKECIDGIPSLIERITLNSPQKPAAGEIGLVCVEGFIR